MYNKIKYMVIVIETDIKIYTVLPYQHFHRFLKGQKSHLYVLYPIRHRGGRV